MAKKAVNLGSHRQLDRIIQVTRSDPRGVCADRAVTGNPKGSRQCMPQILAVAVLI